ncbi:hypothetical protein K8R14_00280 [bacterium]|nr:hypothetical protein [bacterium]
MTSKIDKDLEYITKLISGEKALKKKEEKLKKLKEKAVKHQKDEKRRKIVEKEAKIEGTAPKKVVQNIKLFEWEAPDRYEFAFDSKDFTIIVATSLILILFLAIVGKFFLMAALISLLFFIYVLGTTKPLVVKHKITAKGIDYSNRLYEWFLFTDFYFTKRKKQNFLIVTTELRFPSTLILLIDEKDRLPIFLLLQEFVLYKDVRKQGRLEKMNFGEYIELEKV